MALIPHEIAFGEVFVPPLLLATAAGVILAYITAAVLNRFRLSRFFAAPSLVFAAIATIYTLLLGALFIPI